MRRRMFRLTLSQKRNWAGYLWVSPFIIGFIFFFLAPMLQSFRFSVSELIFTTEGYDLKYVGIQNFRYAVTVDPNFNQYFTETISSILVSIPSVIMFSFFIASVLNQEFRGRTLVRAIFFLPVILTAGVLHQLEVEDLMYLTTRDRANVMLSTASLRDFFMEMSLPRWIISYVIMAAGNLPQLIEYSAIPILIFLAGLQSVPGQLYECAKLEGATGWETFWKITFPLISPLFLTNVIFIIVYSFTSPGNQLVSYISDLTWGRGIFGVSVAMSLMYFAAISLILLVVGFIIERNVFYME
ncbi:MAG: sugar ABC transporter permease [Limnochordia bacterium]|jgi:ABC-type sugar transport system permease subunit|nr:sugar ABC transporter permease [Bacillota bacterium]NLH30465.1 sugar ABC transporter permease [Bacillota bacterium]